MGFAEKIREYEARGYRWITMAAARVLMTNGKTWVVGAKYTEEFFEYTDETIACDAYVKIPNPYSDELMAADLEAAQ